MSLRNVTLEMSLKPFKDLRPEAIESVCREVFQQWDALHRHAEIVSVLLWTADGSEILDYVGDLDAEIEWARYIGIANSHGNVPHDPEGKCLHSRSYLYMDNPPVQTYRTLQQIVRTLKSVGRKMTGKTIRVGATFDPGGEFAKSPFKYERHPEICMAHTMGAKSFVCCYATLNADTHRYAGFPNGIPQDTSLGIFLGRQAKHFLNDLDFDYLWLSNGFGFGLETWKAIGPLFDGKQFEPSAAPEIRQKILAFWRDFRSECAHVPIEVRGTNLGTGSDLATDAVPLREIYDGDFEMQTPPNSPWAAINSDFGIEMVGYMSRIAELPAGKGYPYRFYVHDPWWVNSPWLDRYEREPHDIFLPMSVARVDASGKVENPDSILLLTIDDSFGRMPVSCPNEVTPHLLRCRETSPDAPGLVTWVYPFDEFHDFAISSPERLPEGYFSDWFVRCAVNNGFPVNTVVSTRAFVESSRRDPSRFAHTVLLSLVPDAGSAVEKSILSHVQRGGRALLYGPIDRAGEAMLEFLQLRPAGAWEGELDLHLANSVDTLADPSPTRIIHRPLMSAGAIASELQPNAHSSVSVLASVHRKDESRAVALSRFDPQWRGGGVAWVRGTNSNSYVDGSGFPTLDDAAQFFRGDLLLREALAALGVEVGFTKRSAAQRNPILAASRHKGGIWWAGFMPETTVPLRLKLPGGAPLFIGCDAEIINGQAVYRLPRAWRRESRVLVEQTDGVLTCAEQLTGIHGVERRIRVDGLNNATVRFLPEPGTEHKVNFQINSPYPHLIGPFAQTTPEETLAGNCLRADRLTGSLLISW